MGEAGLLLPCCFSHPGIILCSPSEREGSGLLTGREIIQIWRAAVLKEVSYHLSPPKMLIRLCMKAPVRDTS